jgi:hypothetical protein
LSTLANLQTSRQSVLVGQHALSPGSPSQMIAALLRRGPPTDVAVDAVPTESFRSLAADEPLRARPDGVVYIAQPGGRPPTEFALTSGGSGLAVFENPAHDFPKRLSYRRTGRTLLVEVEGAEKGKPLRDVYEFTLADVR